MNFSITILGTSSAVPSSKRNPVSQVAHIHNQVFLIDCGEGTQIQLRKNRIRLSKINHIFISHLHGDHIFGLFGLLSTFSLLGRTNILHIYADPRLKELLDYHNQFFNNKLTYAIDFHVLEEGKESDIYEDEQVFVKAFPLKHSVPTHGFLFQEKKRLRKIDKNRIEEFQIPISDIIKLKQGGDFYTKEGKCIKNKDLTFDVPKERSYAYCSDTAFYQDIVKWISNVDLLFHESTFTKEDIKRAEATLHSTSEQAATIAKLANVGQLLLGHFSTRYKDLNPMLQDAKKVFSNTDLAEEGKSYDIAEKINK